MKWFLMLPLLALSLGSFGQEIRTGIFNYSAEITLPDTNVVIKKWQVKMYTNDTIVRTETETYQLGNQVYIRHMTLNKAYLLLSFNGKNYAIQTDLEKKKTGSDTLAPRYTFKKKFGGKKIAGFKCRKYYIVYEGESTGFYSYFAKKVPNKYLEVYPDIPGLAMDYYLPSQDGLIHYELTGFSAVPVNRNLFGIPSDYKRVTFDEFVNLYTAE